MLLAGGLVVLDDTYLPYANQRQDALRNQIKGRPAQTYYQPRRQWIFGEHSKVLQLRILRRGQAAFRRAERFSNSTRRRSKSGAHLRGSRSLDNRRAFGFWSPGAPRFEQGQVSHYAPFLAYALKE